jgi:hypothetical protein
VGVIFLIPMNREEGRNQYPHPRSGYPEGKRGKRRYQLLPSLVPTREGPGWETGGSLLGSE